MPPFKLSGRDFWQRRKESHDKGRHRNDVLLRFDGILRLLVPDQPKRLGTLHHKKRDKTQAETEQIEPGGKHDKPKRRGKRREKHRRDKQDGDEARLVQLSVAKRPDFKEGVIRAHIIGLHDLRECEHHKGERLTAGQLAGDVPANEEAGERQNREHGALEDHAQAEAVREYALVFRLRFPIHNIVLDGLHTERNRR